MLLRFLFVQLRRYTRRFRKSFRGLNTWSHPWLALCLKTSFYFETLLLKDYQIWGGWKWETVWKRHSRPWPSAFCLSSGCKLDISLFSSLLSGHTLSCAVESTQLTLSIFCLESYLAVTESSLGSSFSLSQVTSGFSFTSRSIPT